MAEATWVLPMLAVAVAAAGWLAHRLRMPPALGYLGLGVLLGSPLNPITIPQEFVAEGVHLAVLILLFFIGLELDLKRVQDIVGKTAGATLFNIMVPLIAVAGLASVLGWSAVQALSLGIALSISSTLFGERLSSMPGFSNESRKRMLGILLGEDVAAGILLAMIVLLGGNLAENLFLPVAAIGKLMLFLIFGTATALLVVPRVLDAVARTHIHELVVLVTGAFVLAFGALGAWAGSSELGAFVAGVAAAEAGSRFVVRNSMISVRDVAMALFFLGSGLAVSAVEAWDVLWISAIIAVAFLATKLLVNIPTSMAAGQNFSDALRTGLALGAIGEFSLIMTATAEVNAVAHPAMRNVVVGAMIILLVVTPLLVRLSPKLALAADRLPESMTRPGRLMLRTWRGPVRKPDPQRPRRVRRDVRFLLANLLLFIAWVALAASIGPPIVARFPDLPFLAPVLVMGVAAAVASPLLYGTYRGYRRLVRDMVGMDKSDEPGAKLRARVLDILVGVSVTVLLLPFGLLLPGSGLPVLLGALFLAVILAALLWRQLVSLQRTLQDSVTRVLGEEVESEGILDRVVADYPWGVRFGAVAVPGMSPLANRRLGDGRITELTGATVAVLQRRGREVVNPGPDEVLHPGDTLILMGDEHQIARAEALVVAHGEALRLTAQSKAANVVELQVQEGSPIVGRPLAESDVRGKTGALVVGVWPRGLAHPQSYRPSITLSPGDRLILLGTTLQIERARLLTEGEAKEETVDVDDA